MKFKVFFVAIILLFSAGSSKVLRAERVQFHKNALGLRFSSGYDSRVEVNYQRAVNQVKNRLELGLGVGKNAFFIQSSYQWAWPISDIGLNWYVGPSTIINVAGDNSGLGIGGEIGIEYDFNPLNAPILVSFDFRPYFGFFGYAGRSDVGLSIRYTF